MRLEDYWGIGPKTSTLLADELGEGPAIQAIEAGDIRALTSAGLARGRATRILRHAHGKAGMDLLATPDARTVYKDILSLLAEYAVSPAAADRIRLLTPLESVSEMEARLEHILTARRGWTALDERDQTRVLDAFRDGSDLEGDRAVVRTVLALAELELQGEIFDPLSDLDVAALTVAESALAGLHSEDGPESADERLMELTQQLGKVEDLAAAPSETLQAITGEATGPDDLRETLGRHVASETGIDVATVQDAMPPDAADATEFVTQTLRSLAEERRSKTANRAETVEAEFEADLDAARPAIDAARTALDDLSLYLSVARFAVDFDLVAPTYTTDRSVLGMVDARNPFLEAAGETVQPITYAIGDHELAVASAVSPPTGDRVAVLTGANSGGKTTLLETLGVIQILGQMGLPVPAAAAELSPADAVVFHRRHASFNAGVLESTLRSVVPPLTADGRTVMLVDEFEAITEPGSAADLLHGLVELTVNEPALGVFVTHLADDLAPLPEAARTDGIFAEGLTPDLDLEVDYQPRFETVGRSTPEFIVTRLVAEAGESRERAGYHTLAEAVGEEAVQRTLADTRWRE